MVNKTRITLIQKEATGVQPLSWISPIFILVIIATVHYLAYHWLIPAYLERTGQPYLIAYLWVYMGAVLVISMVLYHLEGRPFTWKAFATRYRLALMPREDWLWVLVVLIPGDLARGVVYGLGHTAPAKHLNWDPTAWVDELLPVCGAGPVGDWVTKGNL